MPFTSYPIAFACPACSASSLQRYVAVSTAEAAAQPKTKPLIHSVSRRFSRLLFACAPLLLGAAALVPAAPAQAQVVNICDRTAQVETAILAKLSHNDCSAVTSAELAGIGGTLWLSSKGITSLQASDFSGLSSLIQLYLSSNGLTSLPEGVFSGLSALKILSVSGNRLASLSAGVFSGLSNLSYLYLNGNYLASLPDGVFSGLSSLEELRLNNNALTSLPEGVFSGLSSLEELRLNNNALTSLPAGVFSGLSSLVRLSLDGNALTSLPEGVFSGLSSLEELRLNNNALTSLPEGVFSGLSSLYRLNLNDNALTSLPAGVFSGLSSLTGLYLNNNALTSLPEGVFSGLSSLYWLNLNDNALTSLPDGVFSGPHPLRGLYLNNNALTSLPIGVFSGLSSLTSLQISGNSGAPFQVELSLEVDSVTNTIRILAPLSAPEDLVLPLSFSGGTVAGSTTATVTIPTGAAASPFVTMDSVAEEGVVTVSFGTLPALTPGIEGLILVAGDTVSFVPGICGHTAQVRTAIRAKLGNKACRLVTPTDLAGISGTLSINSESVASLQADDFSGLTSLEGLELRGNQLASLPISIFSDLDSLTSLDLGGNSIVSLPTSLLSNLTDLAELNLSGNGLLNLPDGLLGGLDQLTDLDLSSNALTSLPDEIFNSPGNLTSLDLSGNPGAPFTLTLSLIAGDFNTVRVRMTPSAWTKLRVPLSVENGTLSASSVTIPQGAALSNVVTFTPDSDSNTDSTVGIATPPTLPTNFTGISLSNQIIEITIQGGICSRSPKVRAYVVNALSDVSNCSEVTSTHLASLTGTLTLSASGATTLRSGDFAGLSGLTGLDLANRSIASLPQDVFGDLAKLTTLNLSGNSLTELPVGVFVGLSSLSSVDLSGNSGAPFTLPLAFQEDGTGLHVYLAHGAPSALSIPLQATGGSLSATSVTIAVGETISQSVTFTADSSGDATTVSFGGTLPSAGTGVQLGAGVSLTLADGICARTPQVRDVILEKLGQSDCSAVTRAQLAGISRLSLYGKVIASLKYGDFNGLSSLTSLSLSGNPFSDLPNNALTDLPADVFSGLSSLKNLYLGNNALTSLPADVFSGLSSLKGLYLGGNALTSLPEGVFSGLSSLTSLDLTYNQHIGDLPSGVFSGLSSLTSLDLQGSNLDILPEGVFSGLSSLKGLYLGGNALTSLPEGVFSGLSSLSDLWLNQNELTSLPEGVFSGLSSLSDLRLNQNELTSLPEGVFSGLSSLTQLWLYNNASTSLPEGVFSGLSSLKNLNLGGNALTSLPEGVFSGLSSLTQLWLYNNASTSLPEGVFSGLSSLTQLWLFGNALTGLPAGVFSGLSSLRYLNLGGNALTSLPEGVFSGLSSLTTLRLSGNPGTPFQVELALEVDSVTNTIRILAPLGAPEDLAIPISISGGTVAGSITATVTIPTGAAASPFVTMDSVADEGVVTVSFGTLPALTPYSFPSKPGIDGMTLVAGDTASFVPGICGHTVQVQVAIRAKLGDKACGRITGTDLAGISGTLSINSKSINSLQADDFSGLTSLEGLELRGNQLASLPTDIFSDLNSLTSLDLGGNQLASLSGSGLDGLTSLQVLRLDSNSIVSLPASLLSNLTALTELNLSGNGLLELPVGVFVGLSSLSSLDLSSNALTSLSRDVFGYLTSLIVLKLHSNQLTSLPDGVFGQLIGLTTLSLNSNQLASLPDAIFNSPANLTNLDLSGNPGAPFTLTLSLIAGDFNTVRVRMTPSAWRTILTVPLTASNGTLSSPSVTISKVSGFSNMVTFTPDSDPNTASTVGIDTPPTLPTNFTGITLSNQGGAITIQGGICSRSPKVRVAIVNALSGVSDCGEVTDTHLASIAGTLTLSAQGATTLQVGDFAGLSGLTGLDLANRSIDNLPQDVFGDLAKLTTLNLSGNSLSELPAGVFVGLSSLSSLDLSGNSGAPFTLPLTLREDGSGLHVYLEDGAPSALSIPLQATGGSLSASSVTIAAGETISESVTFTADSSGDAISVSFGGTLPSAGTGVQLGAGEPLTLAGGICTRTPQVRDAILASLGQSDCSAVTRTELAGIGTLDLASKGIISLRYGDFNGLSSLTELALGHNGLTSLPSGVFSGLSSLTSLDLQRSNLDILPEGVFSGLSSLEYLDLQSNHLSFSVPSLPDGVFSGLSSLTDLNLSNTKLNSLPSGVFSGLSSLTRLDLSTNLLGSLPSGVFSGLSSLYELNLRNTPLQSLPSGVFSGLSSLTYLNLNNTSLNGLSSGVFSGLSSLYELNLSNTDLNSLSSGVFSGLSSLAFLNLNNSGLTSLPSGVFSGLSSLESLRLSGNPGAPFELGLALEIDSVTSTIRILAPLGAPEGMDIPLSFSGGTVSGSNTATVTFSSGGTASSSVTVDSVADEGVVTVSFGTLPALTPYSSSGGIDGLVLVSGDAESFSPGICGRTAQVRAAIRAKLGDKACRLVTDTDLAGISGALSLNSQSIASLKAEDFSGLTSLGELKLRNNQLTSLPTGVLSDLDSLTSLDLGGNQLASLSGSGLEGLASLQVLLLDSNNLTSLPASLLGNLTALTELNLSVNGLLNLPEGLLGGLDKLTDLDLSDNALTSLSSGVFSDLASLSKLKLNNNQLSALPATLLSTLTSLTELKLNNNQLSELPDGLFSGLASLGETDLDFRNNKAALVLPMVLEYQRSSQSQGSLSVSLAIGAPVALSVPLRVASGDATLSVSTVTLAAGGTGSSSITVTRGAGNADITLGFGTPPVLTDTGLTLEQGVNVILSVPAFSAASLHDRVLLENTVLMPVQFGEASGLDTPLEYTLSASTDDGDVDSADNLPVGLDFDAETRTLSGTPTTSGVYALTYTATDSDGDTATQTLKMTVEADIPPSFGASTVSRQDYKQFAAISSLILPAATDGNGILAYSLGATTDDGDVDSADTLPAGLDFDAETRTLSGTPTSAGTYSMTYSASDEDSDSASLSFQLVVDSVPTLNNAIVRSHTYVKDQAIVDLVLPQAEGGTGAVSYSLGATTDDGTVDSADSLPAGLDFAAGTRTLSGTPTAAGTYSLTYTATDTDSDSDARTFELTVLEFVLVCDRTAQVRDALVARLKGDGTLSSSDDCNNVTDDLLSALSGTLSVSNPSPKLTALVASDFSGLSSLEVLDLSDNSLTASGLPGNVFSSLVSLTELNLTNNALAGSLNATLLAGLGALERLSLAGNSLTASHFPGTLFDNIALLELDLSGTSLSGGLSASLVATIPATLTDLDLGNTSLPGLPTSFFAEFPALTTLDLTGNSVTLTLQLSYLGNSLVQVLLPEGAPWPMTVPVNGVSGSSSSVDVRLVQGQTASAEVPVSSYPATVSLGTLPSVPAGYSLTGLTLATGGGLTLTVPTFSDSVEDILHTEGTSPGPSINLPAATSGTDTIAYTLSASTDNGTLGNGGLPAGLSLDSDSRTLSGVPTAAGNYALIWTATDADSDRVDLAFNLVVEVDRTPYFAQSVSIGDQVWPLDADITAAPSGGGIVPCTLGDDPLSPCQLPAAADGSGNGILIYSLTASLPAGGNGELLNGLPKGLAFAPGTRQISGTPTVFGAYSMTYSVSDKEGDAASLSFRIVVDDIPVFSATQGDLSLSTGVPLTVLTLPMPTGGNPPLTYSLTAVLEGENEGEGEKLEGDLPAGLQFVPGTRQLTGTPTAVGTYRLTYRVTDDDGSTASIEFSIQVEQGSEVCNRGVVKEAIAAAANQPCGSITSEALEAITSLTVVSDRDVTLKPDYFAGLPALDTLNLDGVTSNTLAVKLETGLLQHLSGLETLSMSGVGLVRLPVESFAGLAALQVLDLSGNRLENLDDAIVSTDGSTDGDEADRLVFSGLAKLTTLDLSDNNLRTLPPLLFEDTAALTSIDLSGNPGAPFEFRVDLHLAGYGGRTIKVTAALAAEQPLPLLEDVTLEVFSDNVDDQPYQLDIPATGAVVPLEIEDDRHSARITRLRFGAGDTGWSGQHQDFAGVRLVGGEVLILDAQPYFGETAIGSRSYAQDTRIPSWELPEALVRTPPGVLASSIQLTYSLSGNPDPTLPATLPAGLVFDAATRTLDGIPTEIGVYRLTYSVEDNNGDRASVQFVVTVGGVDALYQQLHAQILSQYALTIATEAGRAVAERVDRLAQGQAPRFSTNADGSEFEIPLRSQGGSWSLWRRNNGNDLSWQAASSWSWDGNIRSWQVGADWYTGNSTWLMGFMMQNAEGEFGYSRESNLDSKLLGDYSVPVRSNHLYFGWAPRGERGTSWISFWGMAGVGSGEVSLDRGQGSVDLQSDADMGMSHFGMAITPVRLRNGLRVQLRTETVQATVDLVDDTGAGVMSMEASRRRTLLEVSLPDLLKGGNELSLSGEFGSRTDESGMVESSDLVSGMPDGSGSETGVKLRYRSNYMTVELGGRTLSVDGGEDGGEVDEVFEESGWYLSFDITSKPNERGLALSLRPSWGNTSSGLDRLWEDDQLPAVGSAGGGAGSGGGRMNAELSYGFGVSGGVEAVLSPYGKISTAEGNAHLGAFGVRLKLGKAFDLNLEHSDQYGAEAQDGRGRFRLGGTLRL